MISLSADNLLLKLFQTHNNLLTAAVVVINEFMN